MATLKNTNINDTGFLKLPVGTTAQRPGTPTNGMTRINTDNNSLEVYNGTTWMPFNVDSDLNYTSVTWINITDGQSFHGIQAETTTAITDLRYQVIGIHSTLQTFSGGSDVRAPNVRLWFGSVFMPNNQTTYTIRFFKIVNSVAIQVAEQKFTTRNF